MPGLQGFARVCEIAQKTSGFNIEFITADGRAVEVNSNLYCGVRFRNILHDYADDVIIQRYAANPWGFGDIVKISIVADALPMENIENLIISMF